MLLIKKFALAFYNSFLKIELNCDKINHVNFKYMQFSEEDVVRRRCCLTSDLTRSDLQNVLLKMV